MNLTTTTMDHLPKISQQYIRNSSETVIPKMHTQTGSHYSSNSTNRLTTIICLKGWPKKYSNKNKKKHASHLHWIIPLVILLQKSKNKQTNDQMINNKEIYRQLKLRAVKLLLTCLHLYHVQITHVPSSHTYSHTYKTNGANTHTQRRVHMHAHTYTRARMHAHTHTHTKTTAHKWHSYVPELSHSTTNLL